MLCSIYEQKGLNTEKTSVVWEDKTHQSFAWHCDIKEALILCKYVVQQFRKPMGRLDDIDISIHISAYSSTRIDYNHIQMMSI